MTCKDCIHYEVCKIWNNNIPSEYEGIEFRCDCFKMNNYKELIKNLREEADAVQAIEWDIPICTENHIREAADAIEQLTR